MAKRRRNKRSLSGAVATFIVVAVIILGIVGCLYNPVRNYINGVAINITFEPDGTFTGFIDEVKGVFSELSKLFTGNESVPVADGEIEVHFVDVGQGDCAIIRTPDGNIIIDAGTNSSEDEMKAYIDKLGIDSFKYAIFTHPHEDHIGGAEVIMRNYTVENVLIPDLAATSKVYEVMLDSIEESGANVTVVEAGKELEFTVGSLVAKILGPVEIDDDKNNASIVMKVQYGKTGILFTGDAEVGSEELLLEKYRLGQLRADILKLGHHGSDTSSSLDFLRAVSPAVGIISCGVDNTYGHPNAEILARLDSEGIEYHRTDKEGSIVYVVNADGYFKK